MGPKRSARNNKKDCQRTRIAARKQKRMDDRQESVLAGTQESVSSSSSHEGLREDVNDIYSAPLRHVGDLAMILKDARPGASYKDSYDKEGKVIEAIVLNSNFSL